MTRREPFIKLPLLQKSVFLFFHFSIDRNEIDSVWHCWHCTYLQQLSNGFLWATATPLGQTICRTAVHSKLKPVYQWKVVQLSRMRALLMVLSDSCAWLSILNVFIRSINWVGDIFLDTCPPNIYVMINIKLYQLSPSLFWPFTLYISVPAPQ